MGFLANMNFPRWVIVIMLTSSAVLGWYVNKATSRLAEVELELSRTPALVKEIQQKGLRLDALQKLAGNEGIKGETNPEYYITSVAAQPNVSIGQVNISPSTHTPFKGVEDHRYRIDPMTRSDSFTRQKIGNFLYKLEADSRKVRVTGIEITPIERVRMGEIGADRWTFEVDLTSRLKAEG